MVLLATTCLACAKKIVVDDVSVHARKWAKESTALKQRAEYDFQCNEVPTLRLFRSADDFTKVPVEVGVEACGKRAVYVWIADKWILSSEPQ